MASLLGLHMNDQLRLARCDDGTVIGLDIDADRYMLASSDAAIQYQNKNLPMAEEPGGLTELGWRPLESTLLHSNPTARKARVAGAIRWIGLADFLLSRSLGHLVASMNKAASHLKRTGTEQTFDPALAQLLEAHIRARMWYPCEIQCLLGSAALALHAWRHGIPVEFRIGVQNYPFHAHAWVEHSQSVVNDHPEVRLRLAPILVIPGDE